MKALVVVETWFGNTMTIGEAVAAGLRDAGAEPSVVRVADAPTAVADDVDILVVGAPTHNRGLSTPESRRKAAERSGLGPTQGLREWMAGASIPSGTRLAAFDTSTARRFGGSAVKAARKVLKRKTRTSAGTASFIVQGTEGPLQEGSQEAAREWGRGLVTGAPLTR